MSAPHVTSATEKASGLCEAPPTRPRPRGPAHAAPPTSPRLACAGGGTPGGLPEHGDEEVEQQHVGDQQEDDQQQDDQPVGVDVGARRQGAHDDLLRDVGAVDVRHAGRCQQQEEERRTTASRAFHPGPAASTHQGSGVRGQGSGVRGLG